MQMANDVLEELGLSKNAAKLYLAALEVGLAPAGRIAQKAGVFRTCAYDALHGLIQQGLVTTIRIDGVAHYRAAQPGILQEQVKTRMERLNMISQTLELQHSLTGPCMVEIFEGITAIKNMLMFLLTINQPRYAFGTPAVAAKILGSFVTIYHARRLEKKIPMNMIYNSDAKERIAYLNSIPYTEARYLPPTFDSPIATTICGDHVLLIDYANDLKMIHIQNAELAKSYHRYFTLLWEQARS